MTLYRTRDADGGYSTFHGHSLTGEQVADLLDARDAQREKLLGASPTVRKRALEHLSKLVYSSPVAHRRLAERVRDGLFKKACSYVYFVQRKGGGAIKIGQSETPACRVKDLQVAHDVDLVLLTTVLGDTALEKMLHIIFQPDRARGEWFSPSETLLSFIRILKTGPGAKPEVVPDAGPRLEPIESYNPLWDVLCNNR